MKKNREPRPWLRTHFPEIDENALFTFDWLYKVMEVYGHFPFLGCIGWERVRTLARAADEHGFYDIMDEYKKLNGFKDTLSLRDSVDSFLAEYGYIFPKINAAERGKKKTDSGGKPICGQCM